jgi:hypothetical protein
MALKTFMIVTIAWVFFRSQSFGEALDLFSYLFNNSELAHTLSIPAFVWVFLGLFIISDIVLYNKRFDVWVGKIFWPIRWIIYGLLLFGIIVFAGVENFPFIYFQF